MASLTLIVNTGRLASPVLPAGQNGKFLTADYLADMFRAMSMGGQDPQTLTARVTPVAATGTWTTASGSGVQNCIINGVTIANTWATSDTVAAAAMAAAINASVNALVAGFVTATSALGVVTLTAVDKGLAGNAISLSASGTGT